MMLLMRPLLTIACLAPLLAWGQSDWQSLFNGKNLKGWEVVGDFDARVEAGELVLEDRPSKKGGWLLTEARYDNFEVEAEYWLPPPNNSGLFIRYDDPQGGHPAVSGYEINLQNWPDQQTPSGTIYGIARARWEESLDPEGWNRLRVRAEGDYIQVWINDQPVAQVHERRSFRGRIGLQCHGGQRQHIVKWRNLRVRTLPPTAYLGPQIEDYLRRTIKRRLVPLFDGHSLSGWTPVGDARWLVVDSCILGDTGPAGQGFLRTERPYHNFYFRARFWVPEGHNSGVMIRWDTAATEVNLDNSLEINVYDPGTDLWVYPTGSIVRTARAFRGLTEAARWNLLEIFAFGTQVCVYVNGQKAAEGDVPAAFDRPGYLLLQAGRRVAEAGQGPSQVRYRDLYIKDMQGIPFLGY